MEPRSKSFYALTVSSCCSSVPLRPHPDHRHPVVSGSWRRPDFPDARGVFALVLRPVRTAGRRRHLGQFPSQPALGLMVMVTTIVVSVMGGLAFRKEIRRLDDPVLPDHHGTGDPIDPDLAWRRAVCSARRDQRALVHLGLRRATDLDAALWPVDHVRRLQPLRQKL